MPFSSISDDSKESKNESVIAGQQKLPKLKSKKEKKMLKKAIKQSVKQLNIYIIPDYFKYVYWKPRAHWGFFWGRGQREKEREEREKKKQNHAQLDQEKAKNGMIQIKTSYKQGTF